MSLRVVIAPDKFKGTLTAAAAARAIARGWKKRRPKDRLRMLPISDGGDGFGEVFSSLLGAKPQKARTVDAAHQPCIATWYWEPKTKTAVIESARVIGLTILPPGKFHPHELDTFGLSRLIRAAEAKGAKQIIIGVGGSATNDGGFGLARSLGWRFLDRAGEPISRWTELHKLVQIFPPSRQDVPIPSDGILAGGMVKGRSIASPSPVRRERVGVRVPDIIVAVDVQNPLLGTRGATRVYGPQKGLRKTDMAHAEKCLRRMAERLARTLAPPRAINMARLPGSGAAGGLGFGLAEFLGAQLEPGFALFARHSTLLRQIRSADLVITGEGAIDPSTLMGKGTGELAVICQKSKIPCIGLAGIVVLPRKVKNPFTETRALLDLTDLEQAQSRPAFWLERLAGEAAVSYCAAAQFVKIDRAKPHDVVRLTGIAFAAKRHWGYPEEWMRQWREVLTITRRFVVANETYVARIRGQTVGFYALTRNREKIRLEHLWVLPAWMGKDVGRLLFQHAVKRSRALGYRRLEIESDPNAEGFYQRMGARRIGTNVTKIKQHRRSLPVLIYETA